MNETKTFDSLLESIKRIVRRFGRFRKRWAVLDGLATFVIVSPGALLLWFALDWALKLPPWMLLPLFAAACGFSLWACAKWAIIPQFSRVDTEREALAIERLHGEMDNRLIGSLQLGEDLRAAAGKRVSYAPELVRELVRRTGKMLSTIRTKALVDLSRPKWHLAGGAAVAIIVALCLLYAQGAVRERGRRLANAYSALVELIFPVTLEVEPGNLAVVRGRPVTLSVNVKGARRREARLIMTEIGTKDIIPEPVEEPLQLSDEKQASFEVAKADRTFTYQFAYGRRLSEEYEITVEDLPEVQAINYELTPPAYTGHPMHLLTGRVSKLKGLKGTGVLVNFAASTELDPELCRVEWGTGLEQDIDISGRFGSFSFVIETPDRLSVYLTGYLGKGFEMAEPLVFDVIVIDDNRPTIRVLTRNTEVDMTEGEARGLRLPYLATDDFGIKEIVLSFHVESTHELFGHGKREGTITRRIDPPRERVKDRFTSIFSNIKPLPESGERISLRLKATDNNARDPGTGHSREIVIDVFKPELAFGFRDTRPGWARGIDDEGTGLRIMAGKPLERSTSLGQKAKKRHSTEAPRVVTKIPIVPVA